MGVSFGLRAGDITRADLQPSSSLEAVTGDSRVPDRIRKRSLARKKWKQEVGRASQPDTE